ncbi:MAG: ATP-dependent RecD-like DNA helicase [Bacilli bacterium]|jgi:exodeoxyribonuclease V alpha subunit
MDKYIKGTVRNIFYQTDKGYIVGLFKIKETKDKMMKVYLNRTITFTGTFPDLLLGSDYLFFGDLIHHYKYGKQYSVFRYEKILPEGRNGVISFLSSDLFKGIGLKTATKIVNQLGEKAIDKIIKDYKVLLKISSMTEEKAKMIYDVLEIEVSSYKIIIDLQKLGFNMKDSTKIYQRYQEETDVILKKNIYQIIEDVEGISFLTIDKIALNQGFNPKDENRIKACIQYIMLILCFNEGHVYNFITDIYTGVSNYLRTNITEKELLKYLISLNKEYKVIIKGDNYYLRDFYQVEEMNAVTISKLLTKKDDYYQDIYSKLRKIEKKNKITYDEQQKEAIINSLNKNFSIITGGPGTGKTTIVKAIVDLFIELNNLDRRNLDDQIALLAPTGRAAKRMKDLTGYYAVTIHRFLKWNKETNDFGINANFKSNVKLVIIDEASMIDMFLLRSLFNGLKENIKMIFVGDHNQLPSVGPGQIIQDLIESKIIPTFKLESLYRQEEGSYIIDLAYEINKGELSELWLTKQPDYNFIESSREEIKKVIGKLCENALKKKYQPKDIQILVPMYNGINGIHQINEIVRDIFNPLTLTTKIFTYAHQDYREGDKVLQTKNNNEVNVSNGDIGIIKKITKEDKKTIIKIDFDGELVEYQPKDFEDLTLGYAISIHKSQGSEFKIVLIPMDLSFSRMLYRKLIYTAVTRAKKSLMLIGQKEAFLKSVHNIKEKERQTTFKDFLIDKTTNA